jgi:hypothetical protein
VTRNFENTRFVLHNHPTLNFIISLLRQQDTIGPIGNLKNVFLRLNESSSVATALANAGVNCTVVQAEEIFANSTTNIDGEETQKLCEVVTLFLFLVYQLLPRQERSRVPKSKTR